ncbi:MAG: rhodanese-like domain-containing protein [Deltaproteobacteria bacterium]|nr:rhodanese-like domain-containing protein [Deltaproteobacteria bacterium]
MKRKGIKGRIWRAAWQSAAMVVLACVIGLLINESRSDGLAVVADWSPETRLATDAGDSMIVSLDEAERLCLQKNAVFLDARSPKEYARGHISCAINVPWQGFESYLDRVWGVIPEEAMIVTYCDGETCSLSEDLAKELMAMGYKQVKVLLNGWTRWAEAGLPVEEGEKGRQTAGTDKAGACL